MTITLPLEPLEEARLLAISQAKGVPPDVIVREALDRLFSERAGREQAQVEEPKRDLRPIWEVILDFQALSR